MDKEQKRREIQRIQGEIEACKEKEDYYKIILKTIKDTRLDYQDKLKAIRQGKKYNVKNSRREKNWI